MPTKVCFKFGTLIVHLDNGTDEFYNSHQVLASFAKILIVAVFLKTCVPSEDISTGLRYLNYARKSDR